MIEILRNLGLPIGISTVSGRIDEIIVIVHYLMLILFVVENDHHELLLLEYVVYLQSFHDLID